MGRFYISKYPTISINTLILIQINREKSLEKWRVGTKYIYEKDLCGGKKTIQLVHFLVFSVVSKLIQFIFISSSGRRVQSSLTYFFSKNIENPLIWEYC